MNETISTKYGFAPETIEKRILDQKDGPYFNELYDFVRLRKVEKKKEIDGRKTLITLRSPLNLSEKVFVLTERLKKKDALNKLFKASTKNMPFFNRNRLFTINKRAKLNNLKKEYVLVKIINLH